MNGDVREALDTAARALGATKRLLETDGVRGLLRGWSWEAERHLARVDQELDRCAPLIEASSILGREPTPAGRPTHLDADEPRLPPSSRSRR